MSLRIVDVEGDEVLPLEAGAVLVVDPHVLSLEAQLEQFTLGDGDLHLSMFTCHLRLNDVIICSQTVLSVSLEVAPVVPQILRIQSLN